MKSIRDTCLEFFKSEDIKKDVKDMVRPIVDMAYNEIYWYVWLICIYHVFFILIILANLYLLLKLTGPPGRTAGIRILDPFFKSAMVNETPTYSPFVIWT